MVKQRQWTLLNDSIWRMGQIVSEDPSEGNRCSENPSNQMSQWSLCLNDFINHRFTSWTIPSSVKEWTTPSSSQIPIWRSSPWRYLIRENSHEIRKKFSHFSNPPFVGFRSIPCPLSGQVNGFGRFSVMVSLDPLSLTVWGWLNGRRQSGQDGRLERKRVGGVSEAHFYQSSSRTLDHTRNRNWKFSPVSENMRSESLLTCFWSPQTEEVWMDSEDDDMKLDSWERKKRGSRRIVVEIGIVLIDG